MSIYVNFNQYNVLNLRPSVDMIGVEIRLFLVTVNDQRPLPNKRPGVEVKISNKRPGR